MKDFLKSRAFSYIVLDVVLVCGIITATLEHKWLVTISLFGGLITVLRMADKDKNSGRMDEAEY